MRPQREGSAARPPARTVWDVEPQTPPVPGRTNAIVCRVSDAGVEITLYPMMFGNTRLCIGEPGDDWLLHAWCFAAEHLEAAIECAQTWDGVGDKPPGPWHRDVHTGERRALSASGEVLREWVEQ